MTVTPYTACLITLYSVITHISSFLVKVSVVILCKFLISIDRTLNSLSSKKDEDFNILPSEIQNLHEINTQTFERRLDKWLRTVPDELKIDNWNVCGSRG